MLHHLIIQSYERIIFMNQVAILYSKVTAFAIVLSDICDAETVAIVVGPVTLIPFNL